MRKMIYNFDIKLTIYRLVLAFFINLISKSSNTTRYTIQTGNIENVIDTHNLKIMSRYKYVVPMYIVNCTSNKIYVQEALPSLNFPLLLKT